MINNILTLQCKFQVVGHPGLCRTVIQMIVCKDLWHCKCPYWDVAENYPHCLYLCRVEKTLHITLNNHNSSSVQLCIKYLINPVKQLSFTICPPFPPFLIIA